MVINWRRVNPLIFIGPVLNCIMIPLSAIIKQSLSTKIDGLNRYRVCLLIPILWQASFKAIAAPGHRKKHGGAQFLVLGCKKRNAFNACLSSVNLIILI
jgi:hypothetical protein